MLRAFANAALTAKVVCGWLLHCERFFWQYQRSFCQYSRVSGRLCDGIVVTGPDEFRKRGSIRLIDLNGPRTFPECPCFWLT